MRPRLCRLAMVVAVLLAFLGGIAAAQEQTGSIEGVVRDGQAAVLPGATIEARNLAVGNVVAVPSDAEGRFRFASVPPGYSEVTA